jgi:DNA replication protein DnaC
MALEDTGQERGRANGGLSTIATIEDVISNVVDGSSGSSWHASRTKAARIQRLYLLCPLFPELGYLPIDKQGADLWFQVVAARYEVGSIVITTNGPFREWGKILDVDNTLATALIDRLMHHGEGIVIQGDSYRMKDKDPDSTDE